MVAKKVWVNDLKEWGKGEVRVLGKVSDKYIGDKYSTITILDKSGNIRVKVFGEDVKLLEKIEQEDIVDVFGVVREYRDEKYVLPSIVRKVDEEYLGLREVELKAPGDVEKGAEDVEKGAERDFKAGVIAVLKEKDKGDGVSYETISSSLGIDNEKLQEIIGELLNSGELFEPKYGRYKLI